MEEYKIDQYGLKHDQVYNLSNKVVRKQSN